MRRSVRRPISVHLAPLPVTTPLPRSGEPRRRLQADSLALGLVVMAVMTIVQRGIGFGRGVLFCRWMDDDALGRWAMAFGFLTLAAPMLLLGLPGTLTRYVERFRHSGQLSRYVLHMALATTGLAMAGAGAMLMASDHVGWLIFGVAVEPLTIAVLGITLVATIAFNFLTELVSALRLIRIVSSMQFTNSLVFTVLACAALLGGATLNTLLLCFAAANLLGSVPGLWVLLRNRDEFTGTQSTPVGSISIWRQIVPYAIALWWMNVLNNTFELSDRYMILHFASGGAEVAQGLVGQYHSARLVPMLLLSLSSMLSGTLIPYLAADWEAGRHRQVVELVRRSLLGMTFAATAFCAVAVALGPWLFNQLLGGRYAGGLDVLPLTCIFCCWSSLAFIAQGYLWCAERGSVVAAIVGGALVLNIVLNALLLPPLGLPGAVWATLLSNLALLLGVLAAMRARGYPLDLSSVWVVLLPATLLAGPLATAACLAVVTAFSPIVRTEVEKVSLVVFRKLAFRFG